jgi:hypothetical protein
VPYNSQNLLGPGSRYLKERSHRYYGRQGDVETEYQNREFIPNPEEIGDYDFGIQEDELQRYYDWVLNNPSRWT